MNLAEIETFLMIVKTKNITKTAENLFLINGDQDVSGVADLTRFPARLERISLREQGDAFTESSGVS